MNPLLPLFLVITLTSPWVIGNWLSRWWPLAGRHRRAVMTVFLSVAALHWPAGWLVLQGNFAWAPVAQAVALGALVAMSLAALPIGGIQVALWLWRWLAPRRDGAPDAPDCGRRRIVEATAGAAALGFAGASLGWGFLKGRHDYELCEVPVSIPGLPRALDGYVITQISDVHAGPFVADAEFDRSFGLVAASKPDLICVTGDLVDADARWAPLIAGRLARLPARDGVTAVLGNHDHYAGGRLVAAALRAARVKLLSNEGIVVRPGDGGGFALLGVDDPSAADHGGTGPDLARAIGMVPAALPRVLLSHRPSTVDRWAGQIGLQLSGHTHGGQINPGELGGRLIFRYLAGKYAVNGTTLYVNRGLGTGGPPCRVDARPEITRIILTSA